jgi:hypothetical protein
MTLPASAEEPAPPELGALWLLPAALVVHNAEEAIAFPRYLPAIRERLPDILRPVASTIEVGDLRLALIVVTIVPLLIVLWTTRRPRSGFARWCALVVLAVVALNVVSHVAVSLVLMRGYAPGLASAVLVNAPLSVVLFGRAARERWIARWSWGLLLVAAILLHGPGLVGLLMLV